MLKPLCTALIVGIVVVGCANPARQLDVSAVRKIGVGMQRRIVEQQLGQPSQTYTGPEDYTVAHYRFGKLVNLHGPAPDHLMVRSLSLLYGSDDVIVRKLHDESMTPIRRHRDYYEVGLRLDAQIVSRAVNEKATIAQLTMVLGEPTTRDLNAQGHVQLVWCYFKRRNDRLGAQENRMLTVLLDEENRVVNHELRETNVRSWFFGD